MPGAANKRNSITRSQKPRNSLSFYLYSLLVDVSMGLAGWGAGIAGLMNLSLVRLCAGTGVLFEFMVCIADGTQEGGITWPQEMQRGDPTIREESLGDGACKEMPATNKY